jgi:hypothetical protein
MTLVLIPQSDTKPQFTLSLSLSQSKLVSWISNYFLMLNLFQCLENQVNFLLSLQMFATTIRD